ncbi:MAG: type IX secretion system membrane protein PorP/SprF [Flavobacteriales bacterium]|nr:type IX secretion system membrane protein PorP/SprF [Flavobacteriales bacterium]
MSSTFARIAQVALCALLIGRATAQQDPLYSQYMFNTLAFNPAYAGSADLFTVMALSRHQWVGFEGAPVTHTLLAHSPVKVTGLSLGFSAISDKAGPVRQTSGHVDIAYRIRTGEESRLSFGLKGGINLYQAELASLTTVEADPANVDIQGDMHPNFGFGLFWHTPRSYVGLSAPKLLENSIATVSGTALVASTEARHYFLIAGHVFDIDHGLKFRPSIMFRVVEGAPWSLDLNANFLLRERIWFGAMYRVGNSFGLLGQYQVNDQFRVGYAFDLTTTSMGAYNAGTHEVMLNYDLRFIKGRTISPRYF